MSVYTPVRLSGTHVCERDSTVCVSVFAPEHPSGMCVCVCAKERECVYIPECLLGTSACVREKVCLCTPQRVSWVCVCVSV